jgi:hypothetical protein
MCSLCGMFSSLFLSFSSIHEFYAKDNLVRPLLSFIKAFVKVADFIVSTVSLNHDLYL